ncbi:MAG: hypothetical protein ABWZ79_00460 [Pedobacter agri]
MRCSEQSANRIFKGYAWLRKGWFELNKNENEKAMSAFITADKLLKRSRDHRAFSYRTLINHYSASIYAYGSDTLKQSKYAVAAMQMSKQSRNPDDIQIGYITLAHSFFSAFEVNTAKRPLLDSAIHYYRKSAEVYRRNQDKILIQNTLRLRHSIWLTSILSIFRKTLPIVPIAMLMMLLRWPEKLIHLR